MSPPRVVLVGLVCLLVAGFASAITRSVLKWEDDIVIRSMNRGFNLQCDMDECMFGSDTVQWAPNALKVLHPDGSLNHREAIRIDDLVCLQDTRRRFVEAYQDYAGGMLLKAGASTCTTQFQIMKPLLPTNQTEMDLIETKAPVVLDECCEDEPYEFSLRVALRLVNGVWARVPAGIVEDEQSDLRELMEAANVQDGPRRLPEYSAYVKGRLYNYHAWPSMKRATTEYNWRKAAYMSVPVNQETAEFDPRIDGAAGKFHVYFARNMIRIGPKVATMWPRSQDPAERLRLTASAEAYGWTIGNDGAITPPPFISDPEQADQIPKWTAVAVRARSSEEVPISVSQETGQFRASWEQIVGQLKQLEAKRGRSQYEAIMEAANEDKSIDAGVAHTKYVDANNQANNAQVSDPRGRRLNRFRVMFLHKGEKVGPTVATAYKSRYTGRYVMRLTKEASRMGWRMEAGNSLTPPPEVMAMFPEQKDDDESVKIPDPENEKEEEEEEVAWKSIPRGRLAHGWRVVNNQDVQYMLTTDKIVHVRGIVSGGTVSQKYEENDSYIFELPHNSRPSSTVYKFCTAKDKGGKTVIARVAIASNGRVFAVAGDSEQFYLDGIEFSASEPRDETNHQGDANASSSIIEYAFNIETFKLADAGSMNRILVTIYGDRGNTGEQSLRQGFAAGENVSMKLHMRDVGSIIQIKLRNTGSDSWIMKKLHVKAAGKEVTVHGNAGQDLVCPNMCTRYYTINGNEGSSGRPGEGASGNNANAKECPKPSSGVSYDYSQRCPEGWTDLGENDYCQAPSTYDGDCCEQVRHIGCAHKFTLNAQITEKQSWARNCGVQWPQIKGDGNGADNEFSPVGRLSNGWTRYLSDANVEFFKDVNGIVTMRGQIKDGDLDQENPVFTLPCSHRPKQDVHIPSMFTTASGQYNTAYTHITKGGRVFIRGGVKTFYMISVNTNRHQHRAETVDEVYMTLVGTKGKSSEFLLSKGMGQRRSPDVIHTRQDFIGDITAVTLRISGTDAWGPEHVSISYNGKSAAFSNPRGQMLLCPNHCALTLSVNGGISSQGGDNRMKERNYGQRCPGGWVDLGDDKYCQAPDGYTECCDQSVFQDICVWEVPAGSSVQQKQKIEDQCHIAWPSKILKQKEDVSMLSLDSVVYRANKGIAEDWRTDIVLHNGWVAHRNSPIGYFRTENGVVYLKGQLMGSDVSSVDGVNAAEIFQLPSGYRPPRPVTVPILLGRTAEGRTDVAFLNIDGQGRLTTTEEFGSNDWISLDGISFGANIEPPVWTACVSGRWKDYQAWPSDVRVMNNRRARWGHHNLFVNPGTGTFTVDASVCGKREARHYGYRIKVYHKLRRAGAVVAVCKQRYPYWVLTPEAKAMGWVHNGNDFTPPRIYMDTMTRDDDEGNNSEAPSEDPNDQVTSADQYIPTEDVPSDDGPMIDANIPPSWPAVVHMPGEKSYSQFSLFFAPPRPSRYEIDRYYFLYEIAGKIEEAKKLTRWGGVLEETLQGLKESQDSTCDQWDKWLKKWKDEGEDRENTRVKTLETLQDSWEKRLDGFGDSRKHLLEMLGKIASQRAASERELQSFIDKIKQEKEEDKKAMHKKVSDVEQDLQGELQRLTDKFEEMKATAKEKMVEVFGQYSHRIDALKQVSEQIEKILNAELLKRKNYATEQAAEAAAKKKEEAATDFNMGALTNNLGNANNHGGQGNNGGGHDLAGGNNVNNDGQGHNGGGNAGGNKTPGNLQDLIKSNDEWKKKLTKADDNGKMNNQKFSEGAIRDFTRSASLLGENAQVFNELLPTLQLK